MMLSSKINYFLKKGMLRFERFSARSHAQVIAEFIGTSTDRLSKLKANYYRILTILLMFLGADLLLLLQLQL